MLKTDTEAWPKLESKSNFDVLRTSNECGMRSRECIAHDGRGARGGDSLISGALLKLFGIKLDGFCFIRVFFLRIAISNHFFFFGSARLYLKRIPSSGSIVRF